MQIPRIDMWPNNFAPEYILKTNESKNLYVSIHSKIIHKSQKIDTTQMFINW